MAMNDWCPNGCQDLCGLGECGMCGYVGAGVDYWDTDYVIDADEETGRYIRKPNPDKALCLCDCDPDEADYINGVCGNCGYQAQAAADDAVRHERPSALAFLAGVAAGFLGL